MSSFYLNNVVGEAVLRLGIGPCFGGFTIDRVQEEAVLCHILYLVALENEIINSRGAG